MTPCRSCAALASRWPEGETRVTCSECGGVLTRAPQKRRAWKVGDLSALARYAPAIYGRALSVGVVVQTSGRGEATDGDDDPRGYHAAVEVNRRLVRCSKRTRETLWLVAVQWNCCADTIGSDVMTRLGTELSSIEQRASWARSAKRSMRSHGPAKFGAVLWDAAKREWEGDW